MLKKSFYLLLLCLACANANAQEHFTIKANVPSLLMRTLAVSGEVTVAESWSLGLQYNYTFPKNFDINSLEKATAQRDYRFGSDIKADAFSFTPYVRFYPQKDAPNGFYIEPFLRYSRMSMAVPYDYERQSDIISGSVAARLSSVALGVDLGWQIVNESGFSVDIFAGGGFGFGSLKASLQDPNLLPTDYDNIKDILENEEATRVGLFLINIILKTMSVDVSGDHLAGSVSGIPIPVGRFGVALGYTF